MKQLTAILCLLTTTAILSGCKKEKPLEFEPNMVFSHGLQIRNELPMQAPLDETQIILEELFGTPDEPKLPEFVTSDEEYASLISLDNLRLAAGPVTAEGGGIYRRLKCNECHAVTGNGRGPLAAMSADSYPRDYRHGIFKFKQTEGSDKPTREDLARIIKNGIPGTAMTPNVEMVDSDIEPLVDYVIYLSWRGQLERSMLFEAEDLFEAEVTAALDALEKAEAALEAAEAAKNGEEPEQDEEEEEEEDEEDTESPEEAAERIAEEAEERQEWIQDLALEIADEWLEAEDAIYEVPERPEDFPVPDTIEEVLAAANSDADSPLKASIEQGREVFGLEIASCTKCHGKNGFGDGDQKVYDNWTTDWTTKMGLDPADEESLIPLIARGALPPRFINPRDFRAGDFRGGNTPEDLYRRIADGISGTPMPAAKLEPEQIWHLVNFVRSLRVEQDPDTL